MRLVLLIFLMKYFFDIAEIFNISSDVIKDIPMTREEEELFEKKLIKNYVNTF